MPPSVSIFGPHLRWTDIKHDWRIIQRPEMPMHRIWRNASLGSESSVNRRTRNKIGCDVTVYRFLLRYLELSQVSRFFGERVGGRGCQRVSSTLNCGGVGLGFLGGGGVGWWCKWGFGCRCYLITASRVIFAPFQNRFPLVMWPSIYSRSAKHSEL